MSKINFSLLKAQLNYFCAKCRRPLAYTAMISTVLFIIGRIAMTYTNIDMNIETKLIISAIFLVVELSIIILLSFSTFFESSYDILIDHKAKEHPIIGMIMPGLLKEIQNANCFVDFKGEHLIELDNKVIIHFGTYGTSVIFDQQVCVDCVGYMRIEEKFLELIYNNDMVILERLAFKYNV